MEFNRNKHYSAPALARGLWLLNHLQQLAEAQSLDQLHQDLQIPKPTLMRLMDTLIQMGCAQKNPQKQYFSTLHLSHSNAKQHISWEERLAYDMHQLSHDICFTVEWYTLIDEGLLLKKSICPVHERSVLAKEGFLRPWGPEIDAVGLIGRAFHLQQDFDESHWSYGIQACKQNHPIKTWESLRRKAHKNKVHSDVLFNENGVRRCASPILHGESLVGVIAIAECWTPKSCPNGQAFTEALSQRAEKLSQAYAASRSMDAEPPQAGS